MIDEWRRKRAHAIESEGRDPVAAFEMRNIEFAGHGVLIVAKDTVSDAEPLCLALGDSGNKIKLLPCFEPWVPPTLAPEWETGAVVLSEVKLHTRWKVGPCTTDGHVERLYVLYQHDALVVDVFWFHLAYFYLSFHPQRIGYHECYLRKL